MNVISDYLRTQALRLNHDDVVVAYAAAQAVMHNGQAHIDRTLLRHDRLPESLLGLPELEQTLKAIFMALDAAYSREPIQSAQVYALLPAENQLVCVAQQGMPLEAILVVDDQQAQSHLAVRSAQTGWANVVNQVATWLAEQDLLGEHNRRAIAQMSLPLCHEDGVVYGVLHLEHNEPFTIEQQAIWVGVALALTEALKKCLPRHTSENETH